MDTDAKRRALRQKIAQSRSRRSGRGDAAGPAGLATQIRNDPASALLNMGIDDAALLAQASRLVQRPELLQEARRALGRPCHEAPSRSARSVVEPEEDDDEQAPPVAFGADAGRASTIADSEESEEDAPPPPSRE